MSAPTVTRLLTADQLAERWQVPKSHVYRLTREGKIPAVKLGRYYRYLVEAVEDFERAGGWRLDARGGGVECRPQRIEPAGRLRRRDGL